MSEQAWPIRVGGEYRGTKHDLIRAVTAIAGDEVYYKCYTSNAPRISNPHESSCSQDVFCRINFPEDHSPIPAMQALQNELVSALKSVEFSAQGYCTACGGWTEPDGDTPRKHTEKCPVQAVLAKAGAL